MRTFFLFLGVFFYFPDAPVASAQPDFAQVEIRTTHVRGPISVVTLGSR